MKSHTGLTAAALLALLVTALPGVPASAAPPDRTTLPGSAPTWANAHNFAGAANPADNIGFRVYLGWNNPAGAEGLARAVSDPHSASYGQYVTPAQFRQQFAPSQAQVGAVQSWLRSQGFTIDYTPANNHYVAAEGTVGQAQAAFGANFGEYHVNGQTVRAPSAVYSARSAWRRSPGVPRSPRAPHQLWRRTAGRAAERTRRGAWPAPPRRRPRRTWRGWC